MSPLEVGGVVDGGGYVHGVKRLIVSDASIIPDVPPTMFGPDGNTSAPVFFLANVITDKLLEVLI